MSRFTSISILERSVEADLFRNTLSRIPTLFGQLAYLASLRDHSSGEYVHHGLMSIYGGKKSHQALAKSHREIFQKWLKLPLVDKIEDLKSYLNTPDNAAAFREYWTPGRPSRSYLPEIVGRAEKTLFFHEFEILLEVLKRNLETASLAYSRLATGIPSRLLSKTSFPRAEESGRPMAWST
jgi:hypothetical protein